MTFTQGHALLVGVGTYQQIPFYDLPIMVADADAVCSALKDPDTCGYPADQVTLLHDQAATRQSILAALEELVAKAASESTVLFYYVGHGMYGTDGLYYLTTHETQLAGDKVIKGSGVSELDLIDRLRAIPAKRLLVIINACHAGKVSPNLGPGSGFPPNTNPPEKLSATLLATGEGRIILTACRPEQSSWVGGGQLTIFTQAIVDGLRGGGYVPNNQGYISAYGLYEHVFSAVKTAVTQLGEVQEPELTVLRGVGPFPVALYRGATDRGSFDAGEALPETGALRQVDPALSWRLLDQAARQIAVMAGDHSAAIVGNVSNSMVITGDGNIQGNHNVSQVIKAEGGSTISGVTQIAGKKKDS